MDCQQFLRRLKDFMADNSFVMIALLILISIMPVLLYFMIQVIGGISFAAQHITAMAFIFTDRRYAAACPLSPAQLCLAPQFLKNFRNLRAGESIKEQVVTKFYRFGFFFVDD